MEYTKAIRQTLYRSKRWKRLRLHILDQFKWSCFACGVQGPSLEVHHLDSSYEDFWDHTKLLPYCKSCHSVVGSGGDPQDRKRRIHWAMSAPA